MGGDSDDRALEMTTIEGTPRVSVDQRPALQLALTLIGHADLGRVGERVMLGALSEGGTRAVSRLEPRFPSGPLADPHISRNAVVDIRFGKDGAAIRPERAGTLRIEGEPARGPTDIDVETLGRGVTLELGESVALLLQAVEPVANDDDDLGIYGASVAIARMRQSLRRAAQHDVPVLIRGESGSGKELVARAIHRLSARSEGPFVSINMGAVPSSTAVSALFGHVRGAFTGAERDAGGYFGEADGGTLFLDEVAHAPDAVQTALLRALESGEVQKVGSSSGRKVNVRLVAATDAALESAVDEGAFRFPLLMRLAGYELHVPPLRARRDDVARLVVRFARGELERCGLADKIASDPPWLPAPLMAAAARFDWPGNVRQLRNLVTQLVIEHGNAPQVPEDAVPMFSSHREPIAAAPLVAPIDVSDEAIRAAMIAHDHRVEHAAISLGMSRSALYAMLKKRDIVRRASDIHGDEIRSALESAAGRTQEAARVLGVSQRALQLRMSALAIE